MQQTLEIKIKPKCVKLKSKQMFELRIFHGYKSVFKQRNCDFLKLQCTGFWEH